jgi:UPF0755 protein
MQSLWKNKILLFFLVFFLLFFVVGSATGFWVYTQFQPVDPQSAKVVRFVIPKGQSIQKIGESLTEAGLIKNPLVFRFVVWRDKLAQSIQAGSFQLNAALSTTQIAKRLTSGTDDIWVTIPEGKRKEEVADYFSEFSEFDKEEFLALAEEEEGYLFPDTYLFPTLATAKTVHTQLRQTFDKVSTQNQLEQKAKAQNRTLLEIVTLASILEREAQSAEDMKVVAGILYNRLAQDMPLQVDATMQYAKGYNAAKQDWWAPPLAEDKKIDSPYNTYQVVGLPPGPISNPGVKALLAAVDPTETEYLFYITDNQGQMHYAVTYDEHLQNIEKYLR